MGFLRKTSSKNSEKREVKQNRATKDSRRHRRLFDVKKSALNWPKLEYCAQTLLRNYADDLKGPLHIIIIDKQFLTLG